MSRTIGTVHLRGCDLEAASEAVKARFKSQGFEALPRELVNDSDLLSTRYVMLAQSGDWVVVSDEDAEMSSDVLTELGRHLAESLGVQAICIGKYSNQDALVTVERPGAPSVATWCPAECEPRGLLRKKWVWARPLMEALGFDKRTTLELALQPDSLYDNLMRLAARIGLTLPDATIAGYRDLEPEEMRFLAFQPPGPPRMTPPSVELAGAPRLAFEIPEPPHALRVAGVTLFMDLEVAALEGPGVPGFEVELSGSGLSLIEVKGAKTYSGADNDSVTVDAQRSPDGTLRLLFPDAPLRPAAARLAELKGVKAPPPEFRAALLRYKMERGWAVMKAKTTWSFEGSVVARGEGELIGRVRPLGDAGDWSPPVSRSIRTV